MELTERSESDERSWQRAGFRIQNGYWWYFGAVGAYVPFAALYFRELGFSGTQIGILAALLSVGTAIVGPLAGAIADARGLHHIILRLALLGCVIAALILTQLSSFLAMFIVISLLAVSMAPVSSQLDSYSVTIGNRFGTSYGRLRVWGSAGFMIFVLIVGRWTGDVVDRRIFLAAAIGWALAMLATLRLPALGARQHRSVFGGFGEVFRNRPLALLMLVALLSATSAAVLNNFLGIHLEEIDDSARLVGPAFAIGSASELPVLAFGGLLLRRFRPIWLIAVALSVYAVRLGVYSVTERAEVILVLQALHGLSYALFLTATVTLAYRLAGQQLAATAQSLLTAMSFGFGSIIGTLVGGALLDSVGTAGLFRGAAVLMLISLAVLLIGNRIMPFTPVTTAVEASSRSPG